VPNDGDTILELFSRRGALTERQAAWVEQRVPGVRVVRLRDAHHYLFITHAPEVQRAIAAFVKGLAGR
jgi:pimeloyl-ACP methyl ester carboxylesterase